MFFQPLLEALKQLGGQARPKEVYAKVASNLKISDDKREVRIKSGMSRFDNQIAWARSYLAKTGYIDSPAYGVWRLTDKGNNANIDKAEAFTIVQRIVKLTTLARKGQAPLNNGNIEFDQENIQDNDDDIAPSPETSSYSDHRRVLLNLIYSMSPKGFEHFCGEILSRTGVEDVNITRYAKDGGIDGIGRLRINEFVTHIVAFQAKKYDGNGTKIGSSDIQKFRGAIDRSISRGIFFTTTFFTDDAKKEASRPEMLEIELVDIDRILEICEKYMIGLTREEILVPQVEMFERFKA